MTFTTTSINTPHYLRYTCYAPGWDESIYADLRRLSKQHGGEYVEELFYYDPSDDRSGGTTFIEMQVWRFPTRQEARAAALAWLEDAGLGVTALVSEPDQQKWRDDNADIFVPYRLMAEINSYLSYRADKLGLAHNGVHHGWGGDYPTMELLTYFGVEVRDNQFSDTKHPDIFAEWQQKSSSIKGKEQKRLRLLWYQHRSRSLVLARILLQHFRVNFVSTAMI